VTQNGAPIVPPVSIRCVGARTKLLIARVTKVSAARNGIGAKNQACNTVKHAQ
jgi:hypothetical protein